MENMMATLKRFSLKDDLIEIEEVIMVKVCY